MTRKMTLKTECGGIALLAMAGTVLMCEAGSLSDYLADYERLEYVQTSGDGGN